MATEKVSRDVRYALRTLARSPGVTSVAVLAMALGLGANAAIFTVVHAVLINTLPYDDPDQMVVLARTRPAGPNRGVSIPKFFVWKEASDGVLTDLAVYESGGPGMSLTADGEPEQVSAIRVSREYFSLFRVRSEIGRFFLAEEDRPGGTRVAVISYGLWVRRFGSDPRVLGRSVGLNGQPHTVVGVAGRDFEPSTPTDVWIALQPDPQSVNQAHFLLGAARLAPSVTLESANARLGVAAAEFRRRFPAVAPPDESATAMPMREVVTGDIRPILLVLWGAVALVQLIACANVANLLLVRGVARGGEMAIRSSLGATRGRLLIQLLVESVVLALIGAVLGLVLAGTALSVLLAAAPPNLPRLQHLTAQGLNVPTVAFTLGLSLVSGILCGIVPALRASKSDLVSSLKEEGRGTQGGSHLRLQGTFVVTELALALVLLVASGLLIRSAILLSRVDPGFRTDRVLTFKTTLPPGNYPTTASVTQYTRRLVERLEALPGVRAAASLTFLPTEGGPELSFGIAGRTDAAEESIGAGKWRAVSPRLFDVLGIRLVRGRVITEADAAGAAPVVVVNQRLARKYFPDGDALGQRIAINNRLGPGLRDAPREIVGIVADTREDGLHVDPPPVMYLPQAQMSDQFTALTNRLVATSWVVETADDPARLTGELRREIAAADPRQAGFDLIPLAEVLRHSTAVRRFILALLTLFAGVALALAAIGIYGVFSYALQQRTHEIAIRLALGAGRADVMSLLLRHGLTLTALGIVIGLAGAAALAQLLVFMLFGVQSTDVQAFGAAAVVLAAVAVFATWVPARRAARIDPVVSLRAK